MTTSRSAWATWSGLRGFNKAMYCIWKQEIFLLHILHSTVEYCVKVFINAYSNYFALFSSFRWVSDKQLPEAHWLLSFKENTQVVDLEGSRLTSLHKAAWWINLFSQYREGLFVASPSLPLSPPTTADRWQGWKTHLVKNPNFPGWLYDQCLLLDVDENEPYTDVYTCLKLAVLQYILHSIGLGKYYLGVLCLDLLQIKV